MRPKCLKLSLGKAQECIMLFTTISALETQLQELLEAQIQEHSFPLDRAEKVEPKSEPILVYICVPYFQVYSANKRPIQKLLLIDLLSVFVWNFVSGARFQTGFDGFPLDFMGNQISSDQ